MTLTVRNQKLIKAKTHAQNKSLYLSSIISDKRISKVSSFHRFSLLIFQDRLVTYLSLYYYESIIMDQFFQKTWLFMTVFRGDSSFVRKKRNIFMSSN